MLAPALHALYKRNPDCHPVLLLEDAVALTFPREYIAACALTLTLLDATGSASLNRELDATEAKILAKVGTLTGLERVEAEQEWSTGKAESHLLLKDTMCSCCDQTVKWLARTILGLPDRIPDPDRQGADQAKGYFALSQDEAGQCKIRLRKGTAPTLPPPLRPLGISPSLRQWPRKKRIGEEFQCSPSQAALGWVSDRLRELHVARIYLRLAPIEDKFLGWKRDGDETRHRWIYLDENSDVPPLDADGAFLRTKWHPGGVPDCGVCQRITSRSHGRDWVRPNIVDDG